MGRNKKKTISKDKKATETSTPVRRNTVDHDIRLPQRKSKNKNDRASFRILDTERDLKSTEESDLININEDFTEEGEADTRAVGDQIDSLSTTGQESQNTETFEISSTYLQEVKFDEVVGNSIETSPVDGTAEVEIFDWDDGRQILEEEVTEKGKGVRESSYSVLEQVEKERVFTGQDVASSIEYIWAEDNVVDAGNEEIEDQQVWHDNLSTDEIENKRKVSTQDDDSLILIEPKEAEVKKEETDEVQDQNKILVNDCEDSREMTKRDDVLLDDAFPVQEVNDETADNNKEIDTVEEVVGHEVNDVPFRDESEMSNPEKDKEDTHYIHHADVLEQESNEILKKGVTINQDDGLITESALKGRDKKDADEFQQRGETMVLAHIMDESKAHQEDTIRENSSLIDPIVVEEEKTDEKTPKTNRYEAMDINLHNKHSEKPSALQVADDGEVTHDFQSTDSLPENKMPDLEIILASETETSKPESEILETQKANESGRYDEEKHTSLEEKDEIYSSHELPSSDVSLQDELVKNIEDIQNAVKEVEDAEEKEQERQVDDPSYDSVSETSEYQVKVSQTVEADFDQDENELGGGRDIEELHLEEENLLLSLNEADDDIVKEEEKIETMQTYHVEEKKVKLDKDVSYIQVSNGVKKIVLKEGQGEKLEKGDRVTLHCTGYLDIDPPKKFWSTKDPAQKAFSFIIGHRQVIKGWDEGAASMRLNEHSKIIIDAKKAYGRFGFEAWGIPPNSRLVLDMEVIGLTRTKKE